MGCPWNTTNPQAWPTPSRWLKDNFFSLNQTNLYANFLPYLAVLFLLSIYWIPGGDHLFDVPVTNFLCSINSSSSFQLKAWCESLEVRRTASTATESLWPQLCLGHPEANTPSYTPLSLVPGAPQWGRSHPYGRHKAWSSQSEHPVLLLAFVMSSGVGSGPKPDIPPTSA